MLQGECTGGGNNPVHSIPGMPPGCNLPSTHYKNHLSSSIGTPGRGVTSDPVAMMTFLVLHHCTRASAVHPACVVTRQLASIALEDAVPAVGQVHLDFACTL